MLFKNNSWDQLLCLLPHINKNACIEENILFVLRNLSEYFNFVDVNNMITIFFSMLNERRVIVTSKKVSRLTACIQAASSLLYPLSWQYLYIPVLPGPMIDFLTAPVPFLMGVPDVTLKRKPAAEIGEVVILDADSNTVKNPFADEDIFPPEVASTLKKNLKEKVMNLFTLCSCFTVSLKSLSDKISFLS